MLSFYNSYKNFWILFLSYWDMLKKSYSLEDIFSRLSVFIFLCFCFLGLEWISLFWVPIFRDISWALSFVKKPTSSLPARIRCFLYYVPKLSGHMSITLCFNNSYFPCYCHCLNPHLHHWTLIFLIYGWCLGYLCVLNAYFMTGLYVSFLLL